MEIQGTSNLAYALQINSAKMANNQQEQEGQAVMQLLEAAAPVQSSSATGSVINTYA